MKRSSWFLVVLVSCLDLFFCGAWALESDRATISYRATEVVVDRPMPVCCISGCSNSEYLSRTIAKAIDDYSSYSKAYYFRQSFFYWLMLDYPTQLNMIARSQQQIQNDTILLLTSYPEKLLA